MKRAMTKLNIKLWTVTGWKKNQYFSAKGSGVARKGNEI